MTNTHSSWPSPPSPTLVKEWAGRTGSLRGRDQELVRLPASSSLENGKVFLSAEANPPSQRTCCLPRELRLARSMGPSPVRKRERPGQCRGRGFCRDQGTRRESKVPHGFHRVASCCGVMETGGDGSILEGGGLPGFGASDEHQVLAPLPHPACSRACSGNSPPSGLTTKSLPGLVQSTFSSFSNPLLHLHSTLVVQILPSLLGMPPQSPSWSPASRLTPANPPCSGCVPALVKFLQCFPLRRRSEFPGMAYQALWGLTLAPSTASFPPILLMPPDLCICCSLYHNNSFEAHFGIFLHPALITSMTVGLLH